MLNGSDIENVPSSFLNTTAEEDDVLRSEDDIEYLTDVKNAQFLDFVTFADRKDFQVVN